MSENIPLLMPSASLIEVSTPSGRNWRMKTRCTVCSQPTGTQTLPYWRWKSSELQEPLLSKVCTHTAFPPSLFSPLSCFFLNGCLHCSRSFLSYLLSYWDAEQTCGHSLSLTHNCGVAPSPSAYYYLPVWVKVWDKIPARALTVSRPGCIDCESPLCAGRTCWRGTGPKTETAGWKSCTDSPVET